MKKIITLAIVLVAAWFGIEAWLSNLHSPNYLQIAQETTAPNTNFLFASNASLPGRLYMTFSGKDYKTCINTVSSFYNKYHTCSKCTDFVENPKKWHFEQVQKPQIGDIVIQHYADSGIAHHAAIIVGFKNGKLIICHTKKKKYLKNVILKNDSHLTYYRYNPDL